MPTHNRGWHKAWTWDVPARTATHASGLVVTLTPDGDRWRATATPESENIVLEKTILLTGNVTTALRHIAGLLQEAASGFAYNVAKQAYDARKAERTAHHADRT